MKTHTGTILIGRTRGLKFTESPRWHEGKLWFLDKRIKTADLGGRLETVVDLPFIPNAFGFRRDGSLLVGDAMQRQIHRWDGQALQRLGDVSNITTFCLSDGIVDPQDRLYVGDIGSAPRCCSCRWGRGIRPTRPPTARRGGACGCS